VNAGIAKDVGLPQTPCWRRISVLEKAGAITPQVVLRLRGKVDLEVLIFVDEKLSSYG